MLTRPIYLHIRICRKIRLQKTTGLNLFRIICHAK